MWRLSAFERKRSPSFVRRLRTYYPYTFLIHEAYVICGKIKTCIDYAFIYRYLMRVSISNVILLTSYIARVRVWGRHPFTSCPYFILFYSIPFRSILFYSILFFYAGWNEVMKTLSSAKVANMNSKVQYYSAK